jgi:integrase
VVDVVREHRSRIAGRDLRRVHVDALVFTIARGRPQSRRSALRAVHAAGDAAGLNGEGREPVGLHDLRHSYVVLAAGATLAETAALARHANARVTAQVYAGLADDGRETAAAKLVAAILSEPMDVPKMGRFAIIQDPTGAVFGIWQSAS